MFSYLRALFKSLTEQLPVKKLSVSLDLPRFMLTLCTSLVTSVSGVAPPSSALSKTPRTKSSNVNVFCVKPMRTRTVGAIY